MEDDAGRAGRGSAGKDEVHLTMKGTERMRSPRVAARGLLMNRWLFPSEPITDMNDDAATLQKTADYLLVYKRLRTLGRSSIFLGLFNLLASLVPIQGAFICTVLAVIGLCLLVEGVWLLVFPSPQGIFLEGLVLLVVGGGELSIALYDFLLIGNVHLMIAFLGLMHILGAVRWFRSYARFHDAMQDPPPPEDLKDLDRLFQVLWRSGERDRGFIQFTAPPRIWKGMLSRDLVIFVDNFRQQAIVARKEDVDWTVDGKTLLGVKYRATLRIREYQFQALLARPSYVKLDDWKPARKAAEEVGEYQA
jgi:hypothetical protein